MLSPAEVEQLIQQRRSVFPEQFQQGAEIPDEDVERLLRAANWAPTHGRTEPWRFKVVGGDARDRLGQQLSKTYELAAGESFNPVKHRKLRGLPGQSSHVLAIVGHYGTNPKIPEWEETAAVAMAVQNIYLMATAMGYGGYWSSPFIIGHPSLAAFFGLADNERLLGFFYLGLPAQDTAEGSRQSTGLEKAEWL